MGHEAGSIRSGSTHVQQSHGYSKATRYPQRPRTSWRNEANITNISRSNQFGIELYLTSKARPARLGSRTVITPGSLLF